MRRLRIQSKGEIIEWVQLLRRYIRVFWFYFQMEFKRLVLIFTIFLLVDFGEGYSRYRYLTHETSTPQDTIEDPMVKKEFIRGLFDELNKTQGSLIEKLLKCLRTAGPLKKYCIRMPPTKPGLTFNYKHVRIWVGFTSKPPNNRTILNKSDVMIIDTVTTLLSNLPLLNTNSHANLPHFWKMYLNSLVWL